MSEKKMQLDPCLWGTFDHKTIRQPWIWESLSHDVLLKGISIKRHQGWFLQWATWIYPVNYFIKLCILKQLIILRKYFHKQYILTIVNVSDKKIKPMVHQTNSKSEKYCCWKGDERTFLIGYNTVELFVTLWYDTKVNMLGQIWV